MSENPKSVTRSELMKILKDISYDYSINMEELLLITEFRVKYTISNEVFLSILREISDILKSDYDVFLDSFEEEYIKREKYTKGEIVDILTHISENYVISEEKFEKINEKVNSKIHHL